jgi:hypothetical protein
VSAPARCLRSAVAAALLLGTGLAGGTACAESPVVWGVNGHPLVAYGELPVDAQIKLLKSMGFSSYRVDVYGAGQKASLRALVDVARGQGITILPVLIPDPLKAENEDEAYAEGRRMGRDFAAAFAGKIAAWELGNEYDNVVGMTGDGSDPAQFDDVRYRKARGALRGLLDGVRAGDPATRRIVDNAGWCHYGFLERLDRDGVRWDVTGQHWYADQGDMESAGCGCPAGALHLCHTNVLEILHNFGKPIWITEFNDNRSEDPETAARWILKEMRAWSVAAARYGIEEAQLYELLDQPELKGREATFGLADAEGRPKPVANAIKAFLLGRGS